MKYIIAPSYKEGDIIHSASGTQRANHKYIDRVRGKNGKWCYIYNRAVEKTKKKIKDVSGMTDREKVIKAREKYQKTRDTTEKANIPDEVKRSARLKRLDAVDKSLKKYKKTSMGKMEQMVKTGYDVANDIVRPYVADKLDKARIKKNQLSYRAKEKTAVALHKLNKKRY